MYAISLLQGMVFYASVATLYRRAAGVSVFEISVIEAVSLALCVALEVPWGYLADRLGYRRTMVLCSVLYFISKLVFWQADSFGDFLAERVLLAVVQSGISGVDSAVLYLSCRGQDSLRVFSVYNALSMAGLVAAGGGDLLRPRLPCRLRRAGRHGLCPDSGGLGAGAAHLFQPAGPLDQRGTQPAAAHQGPGQRPERAGHGDGVLCHRDESGAGRSCPAQSGRRLRLWGAFVGGGAGAAALPPEGVRNKKGTGRFPCLLVYFAM